jgi:hypothetical protein
MTKIPIAETEPEYKSTKAPGGTGEFKMQSEPVHFDFCNLYSTICNPLLFDCVLVLNPNP